MVSMRSSLRRLPIAVVIALLVSVGLGTGIASVEEEAPASMVVAEPHVGDRGAYQMTLTGPWTSGFEVFTDSEPDWREPWTYLRFSWQEERVLDERGAEVDAAILRTVVTGWDYDIFSESWWLVDDDEETARVGDEPLYSASDFEFGSPGSSVGAGPASVPFQQGFSIDMRWQWYWDFVDDCIVGVGMAGATLVAGASFPLSDSCMNPAAWGSYSLAQGLQPARSQVQVVGVETLGEHVAMRISLEGQDHWYVPGIPTPIRIVQTHPDGRVAQLDLTGFTRGDAPLPEPDRGEPLPPLVQAPIRAWGPSTGLEGAGFEAEHAWSLAMGDPEVNAFMGRDAAYVQQSSRTTATSTDIQSTVWSFTITDGPSALDVGVVESMPKAAEGLPPMLREQMTDYDVRVQDSLYWDPDLAPSKAQLPATAPDVASVAKRWTAHGGEGDLNAWGHRVECVDWVACEHAQYVVHAGSSQATMYSSENLAAGDTGLDSVTDLLSASDEVVVSHTRSAFGGAALVVPGTMAMDPDAEALDGAPGAGPWLSSGVAAGIGAFGILAGMLYAFWPALKAAPLALFSRLQKPSLLEHPTRQLIIDAITAQPGIHLNELRRLTGLANGTLRHHVDHLLRNDLLTKRTTEGYTCLFLKSVDRHQLDTAPVLRSKGAQAVLESIRDDPGITGKVVAERLGLSPATVAYHVKRLEGAGAIQTDRVGRQVLLRC